MTITTNTFIQKEVSKTFNGIDKNIRGVSKLPRDVIIHHLTDDGSYGPRPTSTTIKDLLEENDSVYVHNVLELDREDLYGRRPITSKIRGADKEYFLKNRNYSRVHNLERVIGRGTSPIIFNYNHIFHVYKAEKNLAIDGIYRGMGNFATLWRNVSNVDSDAVQLITIRLPRVLRGVAEMRTVVKKPNKSNLLKYTSLNDIYLFSLMTILYSEEYNKEMAKKRVLFRIIDGINHVDIPYWLIAKEIDRDSSTPETRLNELYDILGALVELRVSSIEENQSTHEMKASSIVIDDTPVDILDVSSNIKRVTEDLLAKGVISDREVARAIKDSEKFKSININGKTVSDILNESKANKREVPKSTIPKIKLPIGDAIKSNVVQEMDKEYVSKILEQDFIENLASLSSSGHMVIGIKKSEVRDAASQDDVYSVQTRHVNGSVGTMKIVIPRIKVDGTFKSGGVNYRMGRQRMTLPIVKIDVGEVAMTSSRSKIFATVGRHSTDNLSVRVSRMVNLHILDGNITKYTSGKPVDPGMNMGIVEAAIYSEFGSLEYKGLVLDFKNGHTYNKEKVEFTNVGDIKGKENYGNVLSLLDIPIDKMGLPHSEIKVKGGHVPISIVLASWMGLSEFLNMIGLSSTEYELSQRVDKSTGPVIRFKDVKVQIKYRNMEQLLLINGLRKNEQYLRDVERDTLDSPGGWRIIFAMMGLGRSQERGISSIRNTWIDAITSRQLIRQGYPTSMDQLLLSVNKLLSTSNYHRVTDGDTMFIRGQDRINDIVYREIMVGIDDFDANTSNKRKLTINPRATKLAILSDGLVSPTEDTSPICQISNQTRLGYGGTGGRSDVSMVARHRIFDENDLGVISESGTDDGKSGTILNTPVNPNFDSIYGTSSKDKDINVGSVLSINSVVAPFTLHDEMKRVIFARIQGNSMIYSEGYRIMPVYTGGGIIAGQQVSGNYTFIAEKDGVVKKVTTKYMEVKYTDGSTTRFPLGREYSKNSGKIFPKKLITDMSPKDKFRQGAVLIWDKNYFARNMVDTDQVELYTGAPIFTAIKDEMDTYEDASTIDKSIGDVSMATNVIHTRALSIPFTSNFKLLVKEGDVVSPNTPVAIIAPEGVDITDDTKSLDFMSQVSPKAKHSGTIVRIEVHYIGDKKDANKGLKSAISKSDAQFKEESEYKDIFPSGEIKEPTFISQEYLDRNSAVITIYVEHLDKYGVGDKSSDCNALKTINGYSWNGKVETLDGIRIGAKFSGNGIFRRIVTSSFSSGILNFSMYTAGRSVSDVYHGITKL